MRSNSQHRVRSKAVVTVAAGLFLAANSWAQGDVTLSFSQMATGPLPAPWHFATLPKKNATEFSVVEVDGQHALRIATQDAYGNMVHTLHLTPSASPQLQWRWRVDHLVEKADITRKAGDDSALKLCVSFDYDRSQLSLGERTKLRLGKISTGEDIPAETLCYVWDNKQPVGSTQHNAFTHRMRYIVLRSGNQHLGQWMTEQRNLAVDYAQVFGDESSAMPMLIGITISADSDNTHGSGLAYMGDIHLQP